MSIIPHRNKLRRHLLRAQQYAIAHDIPAPTCQVIITHPFFWFDGIPMTHFRYQALNVTDAERDYLIKRGVAKLITKKRIRR